MTFLSNIFGLLKSREDRNVKKEEILNQKEFKDARKKQVEVSRKDENEKLVAIVSGKDKEKSDLALEEIRKRLGS